MSLVSEILIQLSDATAAMNLVTTPKQHALLSAEERKAVLLQLRMSVEVLAKLAEAVLLIAAKECAAAVETEETKVDLEWAEKPFKKRPGFE
ncbi:uncharacterized protein H6S33_007145 [Morchella sextelata]|uniref:uncharacterized protein n=1 Tax=Morchella sextelata TaxID=1174677 RepID=UPI001D04F6FD|nr:uncharacterized protein H6S33_007145 [Morchella sextelata]KAH0604114.1 hypothetical protein H6S33_007145 [Morchella sextelata]